MREFKIETGNLVFCDIECDVNIIGAGLVCPRLTISVTVDKEVEIEISSPCSTIIVNKFCLAQGPPKTKFWLDNINEYNSLRNLDYTQNNSDYTQNHSEYTQSNAETSQSNAPAHTCETVQAVATRTEDLRSLLTDIMNDSTSILVVGAIADVQFIERDFGSQYSRFCRHDKVLAIRNTYVTLSGSTKGCYNKMRTPLGGAITNALKEFICSRFAVCDGHKMTSITKEDLIVGSHDCAIDAIYHMMNYINVLLLGKLALIGAIHI